MPDGRPWPAASGQPWESTVCVSSVTLDQKNSIFDCRVIDFVESWHLAQRAHLKRKMEESASGVASGSGEGLQTVQPVVPEGLSNCNGRS